MRPVTVHWQDKAVDQSLGFAAAPSVTRSHRFIEAAIDLLQASGDTLTVPEIADRAGLSLRILYKHFPSKNALLIAVLAEPLGTAAEESRRELEAIDDPIERLVEFILRNIDVPVTPLNLALARNAILLLLSNPDDVRSAQGGMARLADDLIHGALETGHITNNTAVGGTYLLLELRRSYKHSRLFGSELGLALPPVADQVRFCLRSLGVDKAVIDRALSCAMARRDQAA
jgi:AcrR family transcriptional regulator